MTLVNSSLIHLSLTLHSAWDSGAPVILQGETADEDLLVGLGSTGVECADKIFPGTLLFRSCGCWILRSKHTTVVLVRLAWLVLIIH
jgi:hypothetical protein